MDNTAIDGQKKTLKEQIKEGLKGLKKKDVCEKANISAGTLYNVLNVAAYENNIELLVKIVNAIVELKKEQKKILEQAGKKLQTINQ